MKLRDGGTFFLLIALFVGFIFADDAEAGWYGSVGIGAATHTTDNHPEYIYLNGNEVSTGARGGRTEIQDFAVVELGYRWNINRHWSAKAYYFHYSDPTKSGDGSDGLFFGLEF